MKKTEWFILCLCIFAVLVVIFYKPNPPEPEPATYEPYHEEIHVDVDGENCISNTLDGLEICIQRKNLVYLIKLGWSPPGYCE